MDVDKIIYSNKTTGFTELCSLVDYSNNKYVSIYGRKYVYVPRQQLEKLVLDKKLTYKCYSYGLSDLAAKLLQCSTNAIRVFSIEFSIVEMDDEHIIVNVAERVDLANDKGILIQEKVFYNPSYAKIEYIKKKRMTIGNCTGDAAIVVFDAQGANCAMFLYDDENQLVAANLGRFALSIGLCLFVEMDGEWNKIARGTKPNLMQKDEKVDEREKNKPIIRIKKVVLKDFKNVRYGEITLNCSQQSSSYDADSDILGVYGQNGSGKTSLIEAIGILRSCMSGLKVHEEYADCIAIDKEQAELVFVFGLQYPDGKIREATYSFCMTRKEATIEEIQEKYKDAPNGFEVPESEQKVIIFNEKIHLLWEESSKKQLIIDTSPKEKTFIPDTKRKVLTGGMKVAGTFLEVKKQLAYNSSLSFIFMKDVLQCFKDNEEAGSISQVLFELNSYAQHFLYVVDTKSSGLIRLNYALPIYLKTGRIRLSTKSSMSFTEHYFAIVKNIIGEISLVLSQLVPGLSIGLKKLSDTLSKNGEPGVICMLVAIRDGKELPLKAESDGVRKIISILYLIVAAFNEPSVTVAIDEFDAGIFEYLLGEILQAIEESGKGQFIFTSHNLRPLEVINEKFLYFTTTNPQNRYIRLKNIAETDNLRYAYFREIIMSEQEEEVYNRTKRFKIIAALKKAGGLNHEE